MLMSDTHVGSRKNERSSECAGGGLVGSFVCFCNVHVNMVQGVVLSSGAGDVGGMLTAVTTAESFLGK